MYRSRQKAVTGCKVCKIRRKKCDERKPICGYCLRWGMACQWPEHGRASQAKTPPAAEVSHDLLIARVAPLRVRNMTRDYSAFADQTQFTLTMEAAILLRLSIRPSVATAFGDLFPVTAAAVRHEWLREPLAEFSAQVNKRNSKELVVMASESYTKACVSLRSFIASQTEITHESGLLVLIASLFLGLYEATGNQSLTASVIHFAAISKLLSIAKSWMVRSPQVAAIVRIAAELSLYYVSISSLTHSMFDKALSTIETEVYTEILHPPPNSTLLPFEISPFMAGNYPTYVLLLKTSLLAGEEQKRITRQEKSKQYLEDLSRLEFKITNHTPTLQSAARGSFLDKSVVFFSALRIFLRKIDDPNVAIEDVAVQHDFSLAISKIMTLDMGQFQDPSQGWPLIILLCACTRDDLVQLLEARVTFVLTRCDQGHATWLTAAVRKIRKYRDIVGVNGEWRVRGCLDLLLQRNLW